MAARRDRSGLTAKESKIVSKKSRLFDSNTQGIGLPQKSSKATIKAASVKRKVKISSEERGFTKTKSGRKMEKQNSMEVMALGKEAKRRGNNPNLADAVAPKSISQRKQTVPAKPKGRRGLRGGGMGGGGLFGGGAIRRSR
jgi:hypothetical protein